MKSRFIIALSLLTFFVSTEMMAQVAVNNSGTPPHASAMLDVSSSSLGLLIPRLTTASRLTLAATASEGLMVFDTDLNKFYLYNGSLWEDISVGNLWSRSSGYTFLSDSIDYVGIGTNTPQAKLEVFSTGYHLLRLNSSSSGSWIELLGDSSPDWGIGTWGSSLRIFSSPDEFGSVQDEYFINELEFRPWSDNTKTLGKTTVKWSNVYSVDGSFTGTISSVDGAFTGNVGVGIQSPLGRLHVHETVDGTGTLYITSAVTNDSTRLFFGEGSAANLGMFWLYDGYQDDMELWGTDYNGIYGPHLAVERNSGQVAIGGDDYASGYKLSVAGKVICEELRVELIADWPDYVFSKDYELMPVPELSRFIDQNGHLPGVPAAEILENEGMDVGEMQKLLMKKIEELSLYIITQQDEIDQLKEELHNISK